MNGKPLPKMRRLQIIQLARLGVRASDISRELRISHGCVSKILNKFFETGSVEPGALPSTTTREMTPEILENIKEYIQEQPDIFSWEVRDRLLVDGICAKATLPSMDKISQLLKVKAGMGENASPQTILKQLKRSYTESESGEDSDESQEKVTRFNGPFSITNILKTGENVPKTHERSANETVDQEKGKLGFIL